MIQTASALISALCLLVFGGIAYAQRGHTESRHRQGRGSGRQPDLPEDPDQFWLTTMRLRLCGAPGGRRHQVLLLSDEQWRNRRHRQPTVQGESHTLIDAPCNIASTHGSRARRPRHPATTCLAQRPEVGT